MKQKNYLQLLILGFLISANFFSYSQIETEAYFGLSNRNEWARNIIELYDNGYYISGGIEGYEFNKGWNIKTDINLEMLYDKVLGHDISTVAQFASTSDENGNIYIAGFITYPDQWPFVIKLDSCGNKVWCKILQYDDEFEDGYSIDILISKNDEIVLLANFDSEEEIDKLHLVGMDENGTVLWVKPYASKNDYPWIEEQNAYSLTEINNEYYISGYCYWPYPDDTTHMFLRPLFIGIDSLFNEKWILPFYALDSIYGDAFRTIPINDSVLMGVGMRRLEESEESALLMFFSKDGDELGFKEIVKEQIGPNVSQIYFTDVIRVNDSMFIASSPIGYNNTDFPAAEIVIDTFGNIYNFKDHLGTVGNMNMTKTYDSKYVFTAKFQEGESDEDIYVYKIDENLNDVPFDPTPHTYDSLCPGGIQSGTIDLTSCFIWTDIGGAPSPKEYYSFIKTIPVKVYPNPVNGGEVSFEYENTEHHTNIELRCFDVYGNEVYKEKVYRYQGKSILDIDLWKKGMYFGVVYSGGKPVGRCKFVVQ